MWLCVLPDPIVGYLGASYRQQQTYSLAGNAASLVVVDWFSCGRGKEYNACTNGRKSANFVESDEPNSFSTEFWGQKCIQSDMKIIRDGKVILIDNLSTGSFKNKISYLKKVREYTLLQSVLGKM